MAAVLSPRTLIQNLLNEKNPWHDVHDDLRFQGVYTGNFTDPFANWGGWGFLPISGFSNGDIAALKPVVGTPISEWPVVRVSHTGDGGTTFASALKFFVPAFLIRFGDLTDSPLEDDTAAGLIALGGMLSEPKGRTEEVLESFRSGLLGSGSGEAELYTAAEGKSSLLSQFHAAGEKADQDPGKAAALWRSFVKAHPHYPPGVEALFSALEEAGADARKTAWNVMLLDHNFDFSHKMKERAAGYLLRNNGRALFGEFPAWPAVEKMAEDDLCGRAWFEAARKLEESKDDAAAYTAYHNAAFWMASEMEEAPSFVWQAALRCARRTGDKNLVSLFSDCKAEKESREIFAKYDAAAKTKQARTAAEKAARPLWEAVSKGDFKAAEKALAAGSPVSVTKEKGETPLHLTSAAGNKEIARVLLDHGADIHAKDIRRSTPLHYAADAGRTEMVRFLLENGAKIETSNSRDETPLFTAASKGHTDVVRLLCESGAKVNAADMTKCTPLIQAVLNSHWDAAALLIDKGADVNRKDESKNTALHWAAGSGHLPTVQKLLAKGANPKGRADDGRIPADRAEEEGHDDVAAFLRGEKPPAKLVLTGDAKAALARFAKAWDMTEKAVLKVDTVNNGWSNVTDDDLNGLFALPKLKTLTLCCCPALTDKAMKHASLARTIEELHLSDSPFTDAALPDIAALPSVKKLWMDGTQITEKALFAIGKMPGLEWLRLNGLAFSPDTFSALSGLTNLRHLDLSGTTLNDECMKVIAGFTRLTHIDFSNTKISDDGLAALRGLKRLEDVDISGTKVTDACFRTAATWPRLETFKLVGTRVTAARAADLAGNRKLLGLYIGRCALEKSAPGELKKLKGLRVLDLEGCKIGDEAVPVFKAMKHLNALIIAKTKITKAGRNKLQNALPAHVRYSW